MMQDDTPAATHAAEESTAEATSTGAAEKTTGDEQLTTTTEDKKRAPRQAKPKKAADGKKSKKPKEKKAGAAAADALNFRDPEKYGTTQQLVDAYNDMVPTAIDLAVPKVSTVTMFANVEIGAKACERLHGLITKAREGNNEKETTVKKRTTKTKSKAKANARKAVKGKTSATPRLGLDENAKIVWLGKENPYRGGRKERTEVVQKHSGKTVRTFVDHGGNTQTLRNCIKAKLAKLAS